MSKKTTDTKDQEQAKNEMSIAKKDYEKFFYEDLKDIYWVEKTLIKKLPKIASQSTNADLKKAIEGHLKETEGHQATLEKVFEKLDKKAQAKKCDAMDGILTEGEELIKENKDNAFLCDLSIIFSSQKVEHYEITAYGNLAMVAEKLGYEEVAKLLQGNLKEEKAADTKLSDVCKKIHKEVSLEEE